MLCSFGLAQQTPATSNLLLGYQEFPTTIWGHATDSLGNQYFTGTFRGQLTINHKAITTGRGLEDIFWVKTDASENVLKYNTYGSPNSEGSFPNVSYGDDNHMLFGFSFGDQMSAGDYVLNPYPGNFHTDSTCLVYADTAGALFPG